MMGLLNPQRNMRNLEECHFVSGSFERLKITTATHWKNLPLPTFHAFTLTYN